MKLTDSCSLEEKSMANLENTLKSRDVTLLTKICLVKAMVFPIFMYECESWTIKKAESWKIDAFELWCWRRLSRVPWTARISSQSILKEISPGCSLEGLMLKLKRPYFGHVMRRTASPEKTLMLGKIEGRRKRGWQRMSWMASPTQWTCVLASSGSWWWTGKPGVLQSIVLQTVRHNWATFTDWLLIPLCLKSDFLHPKLRSSVLLFIFFSSVCLAWFFSGTGGTAYPMYSWCSLVLSSTLLSAYTTTF